MYALTLTSNLADDKFFKEFGYLGFYLSGAGRAFLVPDEDYKLFPESDTIFPLSGNNNSYINYLISNPTYFEHYKKDQFIEIVKRYQLLAPFSRLVRTSGDIDDFLMEHPTVNDFILKPLVGFSGMGQVRFQRDTLKRTEQAFKAQQAMLISPLLSRQLELGIGLHGGQISCWINLCSSLGSYHGSIHFHEIYVAKLLEIFDLKDLITDFASDTNLTSFNFDLILSNDRIFYIEMNPRVTMGWLFREIWMKRRKENEFVSLFSLLPKGKEINGLLNSNSFLLSPKSKKFVLRARGVENLKELVTILPSLANQGYFQESSMIKLLMELENVR